MIKEIQIARKEVLYEIVFVHRLQDTILFGEVEGEDVCNFGGRDKGCLVCTNCSK